MATHFHKHPRLADRDYTRGAYFVTICATRHGNIFGRIIGTGTDARMELNDAGLIALDRWNAIPEHHPGTRLDQTQMMPDHLHVIIILDPPLGNAAYVSTPGVDATGVGGRTNGPEPGSLGAIIGAFKSESTKRINRLNGITGKRLWLAGYYERAIRRQGGEYGRIAQYIAENPAKWR